MQVATYQSVCLYISSCYRLNCYYPRGYKEPPEWLTRKVSETGCELMDERTIYYNRVPEDTTLRPYIEISGWESCAVSSGTLAHLCRSCGISIKIGIAVQQHWMQTRSRAGSLSGNYSRKLLSCSALQVSLRNTRFLSQWNGWNGHNHSVREGVKEKKGGGLIAALSRIFWINTWSSQGSVQSFADVQTLQRKVTVNNRSPV